MRRLIKNAFVVSVDRGIGNLPKADILIDGGKILAVRPSIEADVDEVIDASGLIASPGFVDAHHHFWQSAIRGLTADWSLADYVAGIRMVIARFFRPEDMYAATLHGSLEALNAGTTTTADYCHNLISPDHAAEALRGIRASATRAIWCYGFNSPPLERPAFSGAPDRVQHLLGLAARDFASNDRLVTLGVCPEERPFWGTNLSQGQIEFAAARDVGARIFWHANGARDPKTHLSERDPCAFAGLLGPDVTLVHMGWSDPDEWKLVADAGASIAFTPETELQMGMQFPRVREAKQHGINFGFGIDIISNNSADLRAAMRLYLQAERCRQWEEDDVDGFERASAGLTCAEALEWATLGGARACGLSDKIGSLTPGKSADILLHDTRVLTLVGWDRSNPEGALMLHAGPEALSSVLVEGEFVKRDFKLAGVDAANRALERSSHYIASEIARIGGSKNAIAQGQAILSAILSQSGV